MNDNEIQELLNSWGTMELAPLEKLSDADLDALYRTVAPNTDPSAAIYQIAVKAADWYRAQNLPIPPHVQSALNNANKKGGQDAGVV